MYLLNSSAMVVHNLLHLTEMCGTDQIGLNAKHKVGPSKLFHERGSTLLVHITEEHRLHYRPCEHCMPLGVERLAEGKLRR